MDSSQVFGGIEECSNSESGWTMYLSSPLHDEVDDDRSDDEEHEDDDDNDNDNNDDSTDTDDSMASDASSGPSHHENLLGNGNGGYGMSCFNKDEDENNRKYYSCKKSNRQLEKKTGEDKRTKEVKEQGSVSMGRSTASSVLSGTIAKVREINWVDKGN